MMKHISLFLSVILIAISSVAQPQSRSLSYGAGYANQLWYSFENGVVGTSPKNNWDIALDLQSFGYSILANHNNGVSVWLYPNGDTADWTTLDTTGLSTWAKAYNTDTSWAMGAFNVNANPNDGFDLGWGTYNMINHQLVGDRLFVVKVGSIYKKLWIEKMASQTYTIRYANIGNATTDTSVSIAKANYSGKNFVYYSLQNDSIVDREPLAKDWDITFGQYYTTVQGQPYGVTGVLSNYDVLAYKATPVDTASDDYTPAAFSSAMNAIGYEWKSFANMTWMLPDSTVYFVQTGDSIWKLIFTGFSGSSTGNFTFTQELIGTTSVGETVTATLGVYPNPARESATLLSNIAGSAALRAELIDAAGHTLRTYDVQAGNGLRETPLDLNGIAAGLYWVRIKTDFGVLVQPLAVN